MKDLTKRTITGAVYVLSVLVAVCINRYVAAGYFALIIAMGLYEFKKICGLNGIRMNGILLYACALVLYASVVLQSFGLEEYAAVGFPVSVLLVLALFSSSLYIKEEKPFSSAAYSLLALIYIVLPLSTANLIFAKQETLGYNLLLSIFIFAWCNDSFAYLFGSWLGKHRLFERHSPKKSWEGFVGGVVMTIVAACVVWLCFGGRIYLWIAIALVVSTVGTLGDLTESMFKRQMKVKDSGKILPGHGGILDRFDILLFVLPAVWALVGLIEWLESCFAI